jgi:hypothetical protein
MGSNSYMVPKGYWMIRHLSYQCIISSGTIALLLTIGATVLLSCWVIYTLSTRPFGVTGV